MESRNYVVELDSRAWAFEVNVIKTPPFHLHYATHFGNLRLFDSWEHKLIHYTLNRSECKEHAVMLTIILKEDMFKIMQRNKILYGCSKSLMYVLRKGMLKP